MPFRRAHPILLLLCLSALGSTSCLVRRRVITRQGGTVKQQLLTADKETLLARVAQIYDSVQNFSATVDMTPALGSAEKSRITEYKDVRGYILFRRPSDIRIIGLYPVVRNKAFDMVATGDRFRLYIPAKNRFITGMNGAGIPSPNKIENLRPHHFQEAMLVSPLSADLTAFLNYTDEDNAYYILLETVKRPDGTPQVSRSVWFERLHLTLARQIIYDQNGNILTDARYTGWQSYGGVLFPKHLDINRPRDEYSVVINAVKMDINKGVTDDKFVLEQPPGTTLQVLGERTQSK
ncbi:MAG: hypothetical protein ACE15B_23180 [Bryobacteraceae bacterium]